MDYGTCRHCGERIRKRVSWPSGRERWFASVGEPLGEWAFCPAVNGEPHEPRMGKSRPNANPILDRMRDFMGGEGDPWGNRYRVGVRSLRRAPLRY